jgi:hypothetical protein
MLESRNICATLRGENLGWMWKGCLHGGVLLPLLWSLVVDDHLRGLNRNDNYTVGYANDIANLINRKSLQTVSKVLQTAVCTVQQWCKRIKLSFNPSKTVVISFTRNIKGLKAPILFSRNIQLTSEVKHLGITLDMGLTLKKQLDKVINKDYKIFWTCRGTFWKTCGLKAKAIYWIYTAAVRPIPMLPLYRDPEIN